MVPAALMQQNTQENHIRFPEEFEMRSVRMAIWRIPEKFSSPRIHFLKLINFAVLVSY
jgi:hypothetical protein